MKKFTAIVAVATLLAPAFAVAQAPEPRSVRAELQGSVTTEVRAETRASSTRAFGSSTIESVKGRVEAIRHVLEQKREAIKERAQEARDKAREHFGAKIEMRVENISARLASTSAHLDSIADRIDARIDKLEAEGRNMGGSIALLAQARADLSAANDKVLSVSAALDAAMSTTTPKTLIPQVRTAVKEAQEALTLVKKGLGETLRSIKAEAGTTTTLSN